ncbi:MAG: hypothetical protein HW411_868, partial [Gammaproteobacteria bacterium]|nr:hypothetical protein [Gammaproteobacteria bacterium]
TRVRRLCFAVVSAQARPVNDAPTIIKSYSFIMCQKNDELRITMAVMVVVADIFDMAAPKRCPGPKTNDKSLVLGQDDAANIKAGTVRRLTDQVCPRPGFYLHFDLECVDTNRPKEECARIALMWI